MIFAEVMPPTTNEWLASFFWLAGGVLVILKIIDHFKEKPPMDKQVRDLEDRLNATINAKIDTVSHWVADQSYVKKAEVDSAISGIKETIETYEEIATEYRHGLKEDLKGVDNKLSVRSKEIFDEVRGLIGQISHLEGRLFNEKGGRK